MSAACDSPLLRVYASGLGIRDAQVFTGNAQAIVDAIGLYQAQGLEHFVLGADGRDLSGTLEHIERFAADVMSAHR